MDKRIRRAALVGSASRPPSHTARRPPDAIASADHCPTTTPDTSRDPFHCQQPPPDRLARRLGAATVCPVLALSRLRGGWPFGGHRMTPLVRGTAPTPARLSRDPTQRWVSTPASPAVAAAAAAGPPASASSPRRAPMRTQATLPLTHSIVSAGRETPRAPPTRIPDSTSHIPDSRCNQPPARLSPIGNRQSQMLLSPSTST